MHIYLIYTKMSFRSRNKIFKYGIFRFYCDMKFMILKTKNITDSYYKVNDDAMVKPAEDEEALRAKVYQLHGKFL